MDGTQSWCHFVQRFKRTAQQKAAKVCWAPADANLWQQPSLLADQGMRQAVVPWDLQPARLVLGA